MNFIASVRSVFGGSGDEAHPKGKVTVESAVIVIPISGKTLLSRFEQHQAGNRGFFAIDTSSHKSVLIDLHQIHHGTEPPHVVTSSGSIAVEGRCYAFRCTVGADGSHPKITLGEPVEQFY